VGADEHIFSISGAIVLFNIMCDITLLIPLPTFLF